MTTTQEELHDIDDKFDVIRQLPENPDDLPLESFDNLEEEGFCEFNDTLYYVRGIVSCEGDERTWTEFILFNMDKEEPYRLEVPEADDESAHLTFHNVKFDDDEEDESDEAEEDTIVYRGVTYRYMREYEATFIPPEGESTDIQMHEFKADDGARLVIRRWEYPDREDEFNIYLTSAVEPDELVRLVKPGSLPDE